MKLEDTELYLNVSLSEPHTLANLGVLFVSLYIDHHHFSFCNEETGTVLETPGCKTENVMVSGVANTTRHLLLLKSNKHTLLGHNGGCLSGTKEVSPWTNIVESTFPQSLGAAQDLGAVREALVFLEAELAKPFVGHNQRKTRQEAIKLGVLPEHGLISHKDWQALPLYRRFIHGLYCNATDLLLYGMLIAKLSFLGQDISSLNGSKLLNDYMSRLNDMCSTVVMKFLKAVNESCMKELNRSKDHLDLPIAMEYDSPSRPHEPFSSTNLSESAISKIKSLELEHPYSNITDLHVDWSVLSDDLKPQRNSKNNINKMYQLQSLFSGVHHCINHMDASDTSQIRIVDFCSGGGHLGIFLAHKFPHCHIILVETKWGSLRFAKSRIDKLGLSNVTLCLAHMGQFRGSFEIGVSLHACGSATDIVIEHCLRSNAAIVSSPCCYGKISDSMNIRYPKSKHLAESIFNSADYFKVSKLSDHESDNEVFMKCIDIDRVEHIKECGYQYASISKLKPLSCSPKNNLIVAYR